MSTTDADPDPDELPAGTGVGAVGIRVDSLDRLVPFYRDVVGCRVTREGAVAQLTAPDGRELVVLEEVPDSPPRPRAAAGLFHVAIRLPDRPSLGDALERVRASGGGLVGASDHLVSEALYLRDPAGNGVELYRDRPRADWPRLDGRIGMDTRPLGLPDLAAAGDGAASDELPAGTDVGHVHLEVGDLAESSDFYVDGLGLRPYSQDYGGARFLAAGGYHHHVAINVWNRRQEPVGDHQGLRWFEVVLPDEAARAAALDRLAGSGYGAGDDGRVTDPDGIEVRLVVGD